MNVEAPTAIAEARVDDVMDFQAVRAAGQPVVFRGIAADWPAVRAAKQSDEDFVSYLRRFALNRPVSVLVGAPEIEGRFHYTDDIRGLNFTRGTSPLDPFLDRLLRDRENPRPYAIAVQSEEIPGLLPGFEKENRIDLVAAQVVPRAWIGNRIRVALHYDLLENIGIVVAGKRRFTLFPPEEMKNLYPGPLELTPAGTPVSLVDIDKPDLDRFPRFADAMKRAQVAELEPGDAIYIPFHWWHAVESLSAVNFFTNYWWNDRRTDTGNPYDALLFALFAIKTLPAEQRKVWRHVFDHYVFETDGEAAGHLPREARGVLGELSTEQVMRMRATLRQLLD